MTRWGWTKEWENCQWSSASCPRHLWFRWNFSAGLERIDVEIIFSKRDFFCYYRKVGYRNIPNEQIRWRWSTRALVHRPNFCSNFLLHEFGGKRRQEGDRVCEGSGISRLGNRDQIWFCWRCPSSNDLCLGSNRLKNINRINNMIYGLFLRRWITCDLVFFDVR